MISRGMMLAAITGLAFCVVAERPNAAERPPEDYEAYFVGHWKLDPRQEDDLAIIDGEIWGRVNRERQGPAVAPSDDELEAYRNDRLAGQSRSSARNAELEHHVFEPGGQMLRLSRSTAESRDGIVRYGTYRVEREDSGQFVLVLQMDGQDATRQTLYAHSIQDAFRQKNNDEWKVGSQYRLLDGDHFQHAVVRDKMPQVYSVRTYARVDEPPAWAAAAIARAAKLNAPVVRIDDGDKLVINDTKLSFPCPTADLLKALGKPEQERKTEFNTIYVWKRAGICAYQKPGASTVTAFVVFFDVKSLGQKNWPTQPFSGELIVNNQPVNGRMSLAKINEHRTKPFEPQPDYPQWKQIRYGDISLSLESAAKELQADGLHFESLNLEYVNRADDD